MLRTNDVRAASSGSIKNAGEGGGGDGGGGDGGGGDGGGGEGGGGEGASIVTIVSVGGSTASTLTSKRLENAGALNLFAVDKLDAANSSLANMMDAVTRMLAEEMMSSISLAETLNILARFCVYSATSNELTSPAIVIERDIVG